MTFRSIFPLCLALLAGSFFAGATAEAATLVQNDTASVPGNAASDMFGQSFTTPNDGTSHPMTGFRLWGSQVPVGPGTAYLLSAEFLGSPTLLGTVPTLMATGSWNPATEQYEFSPAPTLAPGTTYWVYLDAPDPDRGIDFDLADSYAGGQFYHSAVGGTFVAYPGGDLLFEVLVAAPAPAVTSVSPASGSTAGGTAVTLSGTDLTGATAVSFGASAATAFTVESDTRITATSPAGSAGTVNITVTTASGTSATAAANQFTYVTPNTAPAFVGATTTLTVAQNSGATDVGDLLHISDPDGGQTETWSTSSGPAHGTLTVTGATANSGSAEIAPGGTITYAPVAGYSGSDSFTLQVSDGSGSATRTISVTVSAPTITLTPTILPAGAAAAGYSQTITASGGTAPYTYTHTAGALPPGMSLSNAGVLSGTPVFAGTFNFTVTAADSSTGAGPFVGSRTYAFTVADSADLAVAVTAPGSTTVASNLTYTLTVTNNGPTAAASPAFSDVLPAAAKFVSLSAPGGWSATTPAVGATGTISASATSLASGASAVFTLVVAIDASTTNNSTVANTINASSATTDPNSANNSATATTTVTASADLAVSVTSTPVGGASAGNVETYRITVTNNGPQPANTTVVFAQISGAMTLASVAPDSDAMAAGWTLFNSPGVGTQDDIYFFAPALASGASATLIVQATVNPGASQAAGLALHAVVNSLTPDPDSSNNEFTLNTLAGPALDASTTTALTGVTGGTRVSGNLYPAGHVDAYSFTAHAGDRVYAATATTSSSDATNASRDTVLRIADRDGVVLELDDDDGGLSSTSSSIAGLTIPADGTYYLTVECRRPEAVVFPYDLYVRVQSGTPDAETADSATGQVLPASGWVAGATSNGGEVDRYQITLAAGETLFASLDLNPARDDTGWDGRLTLKPVGGGHTQSFEMNGSDLVSAAPPSSEAMMFTVKDAGDYVLEISSADGSSGDYHLSTTVLAAPVESTHTFAATDSSTVIPDGGELTSTITIPTSLPIGRLKVALQINHPDLPALDIHLTSPAGNTVGLVRDVGGNGDILDAVFDDTAAYALGFDQQDPDTPLLTTRGAVFKPGRNYRLGWFEGEDAQGTWTLTIRDRNGGDSLAGVLNRWSLIVVDEEPAPTGVRVDHFTADFETSDGGFTPSGTSDQWACGNPSAAPIASAHSGTKAWKTNLIGAYAANSNQDLVSPDIDLTGVPADHPVELSWAMRYQLADASTVDAYVAVEEVGGGNRRQVVWRWLGPTMRDTDVGASSLTIEEAAGWAVHRARISDFAGKTIRLHFHIGTSGAEQLAGLAIDDVAVSSYRAPATDATLSGLALSAGTLAPAFDSAVTGYAATVANAAASITVTPTTTDAHATVTVNGTAVTSGHASASLPLSEGDNTITIAVTAEDGVTTKTYTATVTRLPAPPAITNADLTAGGTYGTAITTYTITASNAPVSFSASDLPPGLTVDSITGAITGTPTSSGSFDATISATNAGGTGSATLTFTIGKATASIALGDLQATYDGGAKSVTATTMPAGLTVNVTYDGSATAPTNAGSYAVVATIADANYAGTQSGTLTIGQATASIALGNLDATYDGSAKNVTATTTPAGLTVNITYDGSATAPRNAGSYAVVATIVDANRTGTRTGTLTIAKAIQTITFNPVPGVTFGDTPFTVAATAGSGLPVTFSIAGGPATILGNTVTISGAGVVTVRASQAGDSNYQPADVVDQQFTVGKANQAIAFYPLGGATFGDTPFALNASADSALPVTFRIVSGPARLAGNTLTITGAGTVVVRASQAGDDDYNPAPDVDQSFTVGKANQAITFAAVGAKTYGDDAFALSASATSNLPVRFRVANGPATIDGDRVTLTGAGDVILRASQDGNDDYNPAPNVDQTITVAKKTLTATAADAGRSYGQPNPEFVVNVSGFVGDDTIASLATPPQATTDATATSPAGSYTIVPAGGDDANYTFNYVNGTLTIGQATGTIALGHLVATYDGTAQNVSVWTTPADLAVAVTYDGAATPPTNAGSYAVVATITEANYTGTQTGTLTIAKAGQALTFNPAPDLTVTVPVALSATASSGLPVGFAVVSGPATLNGSTLTASAAGALVVRASQAGDDNYESASVDRTLTVSKIAQTITFAPLANRGAGAAPFALSATASSGLPVTFTVVDGPAALSGTTVTLTGLPGVVTIRASQSGDAFHAAAADVVRSFTVTPVAPKITSARSAIFTAGLPCSFAVTATGRPAPTFAATGLPAWLALDAASGLLSGTAPEGASGSEFTFTITAANGASPDAAQTFTVKVQSAPDVTAPLTVTTLAGQAGVAGSADGAGSAATFRSLLGVAADSAGNIYVADTDNHVIRKVTSAGVVTTIAGQAGVAGSADGVGAAATFRQPSGLAVDSDGTIYVADTLNHAIRAISPAGVVTTLAGRSGTPGDADGTGADARFYAPESVALDVDEGGGALYVADTNNHTIRRILLATGEVTTVAGGAGVAGSTDGAGTAARFRFPSGIAVGANGRVYVADTGNDTIRALAANGTVTTLAGSAGSAAASDGKGGAARFNQPTALAADGTGAQLYVLDTDNHTVRQVVAATGVVTTIAGLAGHSGASDGTGDAARFKFPSGIAWTSGGLLIADTGNHTLRSGLFATGISITTQPSSQKVEAGASVMFEVVATGSAPLSYQWYLDGSAIAGATSRTYTIASAQPTNAGNYTVVVSNPAGSVTSAAATLTVNLFQPPLQGGGGGGSPSVGFLLALALLVVARRLQVMTGSGRNQRGCVTTLRS